MPAATAHETANRYICLTGLIRVVAESTLLDSKKSNNWTTPCEFTLLKEDPLVMLVSESCSIDLRSARF
jgi:hypothetical protein